MQITWTINKNHNTSLVSPSANGPQALIVTCSLRAVGRETAGQKSTYPVFAAASSDGQLHKQAGFKSWQINRCRERHKDALHWPTSFRFLQEQTIDKHFTYHNCTSRSNSHNIIYTLFVQGCRISLPGCHRRPISRSGESGLTSAGPTGDLPFTVSQ